MVQVRVIVISVKTVLVMICPFAATLVLMLLGLLGKRIWMIIIISL